MTLNGRDLGPARGIAHRGARGRTFARDTIFLPPQGTKKRTSKRRPINKEIAAPAAKEILVASGQAEAS